MITRQNIENEAAMVARLIQLTNPTGGKHSPTPWKAHSETGLRPESAIEMAGGYQIRSAEDLVIALFPRREDRDLALYFANSHAAIIGLLRSTAQTMEFIKAATPDQYLQRFILRQAEMLRIYADLFCKLGKIDKIVHILRTGKPLCGFTDLLPGDWPREHVWVGDDEADDATCPACKHVREMQPI